MVSSYRAFFGGTPDGGCLFCPERRDELKEVLFEDDLLLAIKDIRISGTAHWLIIPKRHIRDIESLTPEDLGLLLSMENVKDSLLRERYPHVPQSEIHVGYHRGYRPWNGIVGSVGMPDIISVHHLHLHVIVQPYWYLKLFKYPDWFPGMWVSDKWLLAKLDMENVTSSDSLRVEDAANCTASDVGELDC